LATAVIFEGPKLHSQPQVGGQYRYRYFFVSIYLVFLYGTGTFFKFASHASLHNFSSDKSFRDFQVLLALKLLITCGHCFVCKIYKVLGIRDQLA
jgi:hypothetical protein